MTGVSLSRWTMSYFVAALIALVAAEALMAVGFGFPNVPLEAPATFVLVHLVALGWLSLLLCGALFQFVPVLVAKPLHDNNLPLPTLLCLLAGLTLLLCGFLQLGGTLGRDLPLLPTGGSLLAVGFQLVLYNLGRTLWAGRRCPCRRSSSPRALRALPSPPRWASASPPSSAISPPHRCWSISPPSVCRSMSLPGSAPCCAEPIRATQRYNALLHRLLLR